MHADLARWEPEAPLDRIVSNAALQWLPDHGELLERLTRFLAREGVLAVQVPHNRGEGAFRVLDELVLESPWRERLRAAGRRPSIETPAFYAERLLGLGLEIELWETVYHHRMAGRLRDRRVDEGDGAAPPARGARSARAEPNFSDALLARVTPLHPRGPHGIFFPFRRLFFVARRS